jgi:hypothetical protein
MSQLAPHLPGSTASPLDHLTRRALSLYGDFAIGTYDGDLQNVFIDFANRVLDDVNMHPLWKREPVAYYVSATDARPPVPDTTMIDGLLAQYAIQQGAREKLQIYLPKFSQTLNRDLWRLLNGNTPIRMRPMDGGADRRIPGGRTNPINGLPE